MATLTTAVDGDDLYLVVSDLPTTHFIQLDDEIVEIEAEFATIYDRRTGSTVPNKLRVLRAALGTSAASHSGGATLVPVYGAGAGGGGSLTLDNLVDPPASIETIVAPGAIIDGTSATLVALPDPAEAPDGQVPATVSGAYSLETLPKDFYAQDTDPGAVGAGSVWKDTSAQPEPFWRRNDANDGWTPDFAPKTLAAGDDEANSNMTAETSGAGGANAKSQATTTGAGNADARPTATSGGGMLGAASTGSALAGPTASSDDGSANVQGQSTTTGEGDATAGSSATASGTGAATVEVNAFTQTGIAKVDARAIRGAVSAGIYAEVDGGVAKLGFNAVATGGGITIPVIPAVPTEQDIADVLVALGLATQAV